MVRHNKHLVHLLKIANTKIIVGTRYCRIILVDLQDIEIYFIRVDDVKNNDEKMKHTRTIIK